MVFYLVAHKGGALDSSADDFFFPVDFYKCFSTFICDFLSPEYGRLDSSQVNRA